MRRKETTCGYCGCGCGIYVNMADDGTMLGVTPSYNHVVSQGKLCSKGWHGFAFVKDSRRLSSPLIRQSDGSFREASWEEALEKVATGLKAAMTGGDNTNAIGVVTSARCTNEENFMLAKLARAGLKTSSIDHCARL
ncbi:Molybdopterin oxidoreductase Fe4S4 domain-containing protein [Anoxynatronum buryatiense]|nr:Molybdopterin oxidoreductase Fe4S4 domain-containing protein [Anoxynatronum buryatiense]